MRNKSRHRGKIKDRSNNGEGRESGEGGTNAKPNRLKVSAPHFTADGDFTMHSSLFTILPLRLSKKQLFSATVMALV